MADIRRVLHVSNITHSLTESELSELFAIAGNVTDVRIIREGFPFYAFVKFESENDARRGLRIDGKSLGSSKLRVQLSRQPFPEGGGESRLPALSRLTRTTTTAAAPSDSYESGSRYDVQLSNIPVFMKESGLRHLFEAFGRVTNVVMYSDASGLATGSGKVTFTSLENASRASVEMNGRKLDGSYAPLSCYLTKDPTTAPTPRSSTDTSRFHPYSTVRSATGHEYSANPVNHMAGAGNPYEAAPPGGYYPSYQPGYPVQHLPQTMYPQTSLGQVQAPSSALSKPVAVYVANLPETSCKNCLLYQLFAPYGCIISVKAMDVKPKDGSKDTGLGWYGFINYKDASMANLAVQTLNQSSLDGNVLKVVLKDNSRRKF